MSCVSDSLQVHTYTFCHFSFEFRSNLFRKLFFSEKYYNICVSPRLLTNIPTSMTTFYQTSAMYKGWMTRGGYRRVSCEDVVMKNVSIQIHVQQDKKKVNTSWPCDFWWSFRVEQSSWLVKMAQTVRRAIEGRYPSCYVSSRIQERRAKARALR